MNVFVEQFISTLSNTIHVEQLSWFTSEQVLGHAACELYAVQQIQTDQGIS